MKSAEEVITYNRRKILVKWMAANSLPKGKISQVSGYCFYKNKLLIVKKDNHWCFPGGHPLKKENPKETLYREVMEEASVKIAKPILIGYLKIDDPENKGPEGKHYFQIRYKALVQKIYPFSGKYETGERRFVKINELKKFIPWVENKTVFPQIQTALNKMNIDE